MRENIQARIVTEAVAFDLLPHLPRWKLISDANLIRKQLTHWVPGVLALNWWAFNCNCLPMFQWKVTPASTGLDISWHAVTELSHFQPQIQPSLHPQVLVGWAAKCEIAQNMNHPGHPGDFHFDHYRSDVSLPCEMNTTFGAVGDLVCHVPMSPDN